MIGVSREILKKGPTPTVISSCRAVVLGAETARVQRLVFLAGSTANVKAVKTEVQLRSKSGQTVVKQWSTLNSGQILGKLQTVDSQTVAKQ